MRPIALFGVLVCAVLQAGEPRVVWADGHVNLLGTPSPDGRYLSFSDPVTGDLAVRELATGHSRTVVRKPAGSRQYAYFSAISPDSRRIAYAWFNEEGFYDLRAVALEGGTPKVLYRNEEAGFVQPCAWSPDGKHVLTLLFRKDNISQIALAPAEGGPVKILRSLSWVYPKKMDWSPDGRFIVYDSFSSEGSGEGNGDRTLNLLAVDGSRAFKLIDKPGNYLFPIGTPDGKSVVFASDRSRSMDACEMIHRVGSRQRVISL